MGKNIVTTQTLAVVKNLFRALSETEKACPIPVLTRKGYIKPQYRETRTIGEFLIYVSNFMGNINKPYRHLVSQLDSYLQNTEARGEISLYQPPIAAPAPSIVPEPSPIAQLLAPTQPRITLFSRLTEVIAHFISLAHETRASKLNMIFEGLSLTEIAKIHNCSPERVRQIKVEFIKKITDELSWNSDLTLGDSELIENVVSSLRKELISMSQRDAVINFGFKNTPQCRFILDLMNLKLEKRGYSHYFSYKRTNANQAAA